jgi:LacI family transcriptional regulator
VSGRNGRPTMVDVARTAGVALSTVSRVVNGDTTVGAELVDRVHGAIALLGWEADERARHLRLGVSGTIGAAVYELDSPFLRGAERAARSAGLMVLVTSTSNDARLESDAIRSLVRRRVDGLIIEKRVGEAGAYLSEQIERGLPVVAIDQPLSGIAADSVVSDNEGGIARAYAHLRARGHRHIAYVGDDEALFTGRARAEAFRTCALGAGQSPEGRVFTGEVSRERIGADLARALAGQLRPTALVTGNARTTLEVFRCLGIGLSGLDLVGFDDLELTEIVEPPVSVVAQDYAAFGRAALDMITSRIADPTVAPRQAVIGVQLIDRGAGPDSGVEHRGAWRGGHLADRR